MSDRPTKDPAASAPLSELVAMNIAGDIEAVADELASERHYECDDCWYSCPESGEGCCNDNYPRGSGCTCHAKRSHTLAARLRRIAAGIRGTLGEEDQ